MTTTRRIVDISTHDLPAGYEASETSEAKAVAFDHLEGVYISDSGEAITAADRVVEALIEAGWRPTVEAPAAEHHEPPNADAPTDAEVDAAADVLEGLDGCDFATVARAALVAARTAARHE